jgi:hypothetical protein
VVSGAERPLALEGFVESDEPGGRAPNGTGRGNGTFRGSKESDMAETERGKPATFDPRTGEVHGSGSGAGGGGNPDEDYDADPMAGSGREPAGGPRPADAAAGRPTDPDEGI